MKEIKDFKIVSWHEFPFDLLMEEQSKLKDGVRRTLKDRKCNSKLQTEYRLTERGIAIDVVYDDLYGLAVLNGSLPSDRWIRVRFRRHFLQSPQSTGFRPATIVIISTK